MMKSEEITKEEVSPNRDVRVSKMKALSSFGSYKMKSNDESSIAAKDRTGFESVEIQNVLFRKT